MSRQLRSYLLIILACAPEALGQNAAPGTTLRINEKGYFETPGVNVMVFDDFYPEGHQGGITLVQCGTRVAANGDVRLEPAPGQWSPVPKLDSRTIDRKSGAITVELHYPDSTRERGFNPITYPDLRFHYSIRASAEGKSIRLTVTLPDPLPEGWAGKVGFNLELFPGELFGEHYQMDGKTGIFPRQANGPVLREDDGTVQIAPMASGRNLIIAPGSATRMLRVECLSGELQLIDGRALHNNGWFILRSPVAAGANDRAVEWLITPEAPSDWHSTPVIQLSQIGFHPKEEKFAVIELDGSETTPWPIQLMKVERDSARSVLGDPEPALWGKFLRSRYLRFDFSRVRDEGIYEIRYGPIRSHQFEIRRSIYTRGVWQPTLEVFLPVQMCHMRINDRYKVWHGLCHMDDAMMAPVNHNHFDGYSQRESTLTQFAPGEHVPGLNAGGWHDAGDYDLRVESQAETVYKLALAEELFRCDEDGTSVDQKRHLATILRPDGVPDVLQQIEHGVLSLVGSFEAMGRLYRGIICPTLQQYVHLGDASTMTDNLISRKGGTDPVLQQTLPRDDRWVFTEENPDRELLVARALAACGRVLRKQNPDLAARCVTTAETLWTRVSSCRELSRISAAAELYLTTSRKEYAAVLLSGADSIAGNIFGFAEVVGRILDRLGDRELREKLESAAVKALARVQEEEKENPYGVPYRPQIWGAGWGIQSLGVKELFLHLAFPQNFPADHAFRALRFVLGCHPGPNTASFASGVGVNSLTVAYGVNRDDWSYIPGGVASGTALIRPDLPELKVWPYLWQQTEYVMGGGAVDFMLLALAADRLLNR